MAKIRTFISIDLPEEIKKDIKDLQDRLKTHGGHIGWVRPEAIHLTLKFLGAIDEKEITGIEAVVKKAVIGLDPFYLRISGLGVFPNLKRPKVIWVGVNEEGNGLIRIQSRIEDEMERIGYSKENRKFNPHLTIGRVRDIYGLKQIIDGIEAEKGIDLNGFHVTGVSFIKSELRSEGAIYTRLFETTFKL